MVKHRFYDAFREESYPGEFPYRQRVVALFQNLDGVDPLEKEPGNVFGAPIAVAFGIGEAF